MPYKNREQQLEAQKRWYRRRHEVIKDRLSAYAKQNKKNVREWFVSFKAKLSCMKCGEDHPACIQFHHREPKLKRFSIGVAVGSGLAIATILEEIEKCDVLCANCHMKWHYGA